MSGAGAVALALAVAGLSACGDAGDGERGADDVEVRAEPGGESFATVLPPIPVDLTSDWREALVLRDLGGSFAQQELREIADALELVDSVGEPIGFDANVGVDDATGRSAIEVSNVTLAPGRWAALRGVVRGREHCLRFAQASLPVVASVKLDRDADRVLVTVTFSEGVSEEGGWLDHAVVADDEPCAHLPGSFDDPLRVPHFVCAAESRVFHVDLGSVRSLGGAAVTDFEGQPFVRALRWDELDGPHASVSRVWAPPPCPVPLPL
jgi:hypothetical protein